MTKKKTPKPAKTAPKPVNNYQSVRISYVLTRFTIYKDDEILMQYVADGPQEGYRLRCEGYVSRDEYLAAARAPVVGSLDPADDDTGRDADGDNS